MTGTVLTKHKPRIGKPQTNGIGNHTHVCGSHIPQTGLNDSNYELGITKYLRTVKLRTSLIMGTFTDWNDDHVIIIQHQLKLIGHQIRYIAVIVQFT